MAIKVVTGLMVGAGAPLLWTGSGVYLARIARKHARVKTTLLCPSQEEVKAAEVVALSSFNGIFYSIFQTTGLIGCLSAGVLFLLVKSLDTAYTLIFSSLTLV